MGYVPRQSLFDFMAHVKGALNAGGLRYVDAGRPVCRVAVLGGSGGGDMPDALAAGADTYVTADVKHHQFLDAAQMGINLIAAGADTYVTADVKHHQFLDAAQMGINLIDAGHFSTENVVVPVLAGLLEERFPELEVRISRTHTQPERFFQDT